MTKSIVCTLTPRLIRLCCLRLWSLTITFQRIGSNKCFKYNTSAVVSLSYLRLQLAHRLVLDGCGVTIYFRVLMRPHYTVSRIRPLWWLWLSVGHEGPDLVSLVNALIKYTEWWWKSKWDIFPSAKAQRGRHFDSTLLLLLDLYQRDDVREAVPGLKFCSRTTTLHTAGLIHSYRNHHSACLMGQ